VRFVGSGHPAIRATHHKTLELTPRPEITERATCVVAVGCTGPEVPVAGDLRITIRVGDQAFALAARGNSSWQPGGAAVIRRSPLRLPGTFATHATAAAADLPRTLAADLRRPETEVTVAAEPVPGRRCVVLFGVDAARPDDARLRAELAAAEVIVAEDEETARLIDARVTAGPVPVNGRTLVLAARRLPGRTLTDALDGADVETVGLPPALAAAAAARSRGPVVLAGPDADPVRMLRELPADARLVLEVPAEQVLATLRRAAEVRGAASAVMVQGSAAPVRVATDLPVDLWGADPVHLCFDHVALDDALDPRVRAALDALLDEKVPTRPAARALAELTGWSRRAAYDYVLDRGRTR